MSALCLVAEAKYWALVVSSELWNEGVLKMLKIMDNIKSLRRMETDLRLSKRYYNWGIFCLKGCGVSFH